MDIFDIRFVIVGIFVIALGIFRQFMPYYVIYGSLSGFPIHTLSGFVYNVVGALLLIFGIFRYRISWS